MRHALVLGLAFLAVGCDDVTTGHLADPAGAVRIVRVLVQDSPVSVTAALAEGNSTRGAAVDLLDRTDPVACDESNPCQVLMAFGGGLGDFTCRNGTCNDPLKAPSTGVPLNPDTDAVPAMPAMPPMPAMGCTPATDGTPATDATPAVAGVAVRIVVSKLLDADKITSDGTTLLPGIVDVLDDTGTALPPDQVSGSWDPGGSPEFTSDPILAPFGPAIQLTVLGLAHSTKYTVVIHPALIQDRDGNPAADQDGNLLVKDLALPFTTEDVSANATVGSFKTVGPYQLPGDFTPLNDALPVMYATDVLQLAFWSNVDIDSFNFVLTGPDGRPVTTAEKYFDSPPDPETNTCPEALSSTMQVDLYNTTGTPGQAAPWPVGTYKLVFAVNSTDDNTSTFRSSSWPGAAKDGTLTFTVVEPPPDNSADTDSSVIELHPLPESCPCL